MEQMTIPLISLVSGVILWCIWLTIKTFQNDKAIAVNTSNDIAVNNQITSLKMDMSTRIDKLETHVDNKFDMVNTKFEKVFDLLNRQDVDKHDLEYELLKKDIENLKDQFNRFSSHLESEQRVYNGTAKRVDQLEGWTKRVQELTDKLDNIVRNGNGGLVLRVDRLEQREQSSGRSWRMWLTIAAVIISLLSLIKQFL